MDTRGSTEVNPVCYVHDDVCLKTSASCNFDLPALDIDCCAISDSYSEFFCTATVVRHRGQTPPPSPPPTISPVPEHVADDSNQNTGQWHRQTTTGVPSQGNTASTTTIAQCRRAQETLLATTQSHTAHTQRSHTNYTHSTHTAHTQAAHTQHTPPRSRIVAARWGRSRECCSNTGATPQAHTRSHDSPAAKSIRRPATPTPVRTPHQQRVARLNRAYRHLYGTDHVVRDCHAPSPVKSDAGDDDASTRDPHHTMTTAANQPPMAIDKTADHTPMAIGKTADHSPMAIDKATKHTPIDKTVPAVVDATCAPTKARAPDAQSGLAGGRRASGGENAPAASSIACGEAGTTDARATDAGGEGTAHVRTRFLLPRYAR